MSKFSFNLVTVVGLPQGIERVGLETGVLEVLSDEVARAAKVSEVTAETSIVRDLGFDSLAVMNFIMALEDRFDMIIPIDRVADVDTVGELAEAIETLKSEQLNS